MVRSTDTNTPATFGALVIVGLVGGAIGGVVSFLIWLIAAAVGMPTEVEVPGLGITSLQWFNFILLATVSGLGAGVVAGLLRHRVSGPQILMLISVVVLIASFITPVAQPDEVAWSTRMVLGFTHILVFFTVVPALQQRMLPR
jgi:nitrate/nitrite transporter NarK